MKIEQTEMDGGILKVSLNGALDIAGASEVSLPFSVIAGKRDKVMLDFTNMSFIASIGVRELLKAAKAIVGKGGKMVIYNSSDEARRVMTSIGVDQFIPLLENEAAAISALD